MTQSRKPLRLALIGWGAINRRVAELLAERSKGDIAIAAVAVRNAAAASDIPARAKLITTPDKLAGLNLDLIVEAAREAEELGIPAIALFPFTDPALRTEDAREAWNPDNLVCRATRAVREANIGVGVILDVALDPYTSHGHDGLLIGGKIANDETLNALIKQSLVQAEAG